MPTVRYQIRNEYGLADPELYLVADKEDPEALLEGVAMAGLVGVLRQLGDLAEFAATIFHDLHEEVTATAARGHELMLRVQQLEAEFPSIEKAFLAQTNHSQFAYNEGIDWHANVRVDQNLVIQGDMPRFILDSYEECRGPPRLFMLDKFDVAGAGACLKRYSDPSFFKVELASSGLMEEDVLREKKARKIKKRGSRWRNGETAESFLAPLINSNLQPENSGHVSSKVPTRRVKLKSRNLLDSEITNRKSYIEHLIEPHSLEQKVWPENSITSLSIKGSVYTSELTPEASEAIVDAITDSPIAGVGVHTESSTREIVANISIKELENNQVKRAKLSGTIPWKMVTTGSEIETETSYVSCKAEKSLLALLNMDQKRSTDEKLAPEGGSDEYSPNAKTPTMLPDVDPKKYLAYTGFSRKGDLDDCKSDDISSDLDNYLDALNTIESELETDTESREKSELSFSNMRTHGMDSESCQPKQEFSDQIPSDAVENSIASKELNGVIEHSSSNSDISHDLADTQLQNQENGFGMPANQEFLKETSPEVQDNSNVEEYADSVQVLPNGSNNDNELDVASIKSEVGDAYSGSFLTDSASSHVNLCTQGNDESQPVDPLQDDATSDYVEGSLVVTEKLDCKVEELSDSCSNSAIILDESTLLSKMGDSSIQTKDEGIYPAVCVEEQSSETPLGIVVTSDHLPPTVNGSAFEVISAQHIEPTVDLSADSVEEEHDSVEEDGEACFDGSVLSSIPELAPEFGTTVLHPEDFVSNISNNDVCSSNEVAQDFDGVLPFTEESTKFPPQAYNGMRFAEPTKSSGNLSDHLFSLSEIHEEVGSIANPKDSVGSEISSKEVKNFHEVFVDLDGALSFTEEISEFPSHVYNDMELTGPMENTGIVSDDSLPLCAIPERNCTLEDDEPNLFEDSEDIRLKISPKNVLVMHVEGSPINSTVQLGALQELSEQYNKSSSKDFSSSNSSLSLQNSQLATEPDVFPMHAGNDLPVVEGFGAGDMEEIKHLLPGMIPFESECASDPNEPPESEVLSASPRREESTDCICPPLNSSTDGMGEVDILMCNAGPLELAYFSDGKELNESHDAYSVGNLPSDVLFTDDVQLQNEEFGCLVTSDAEEPESHDADQEERLSCYPASEMFRDSSHMHDKEPGSVMIYSSSPVADTVDEPIADASEFPNVSKEDMLHEEALQIDEDTESDDPSEEYVIVESDHDSQDTTSIYSGKASGFDMQLQENYLHQNAVLAEHGLDDKETFNYSAEVASSEFPILGTSNISDTQSFDGACTLVPPEDVEPYIDGDDSIYPAGSDDSVSREVMFPRTHSSVEAEIPSQGQSEADVEFSNVEGEPSAASDQEGEHFEASDTQSQRACVDEKNLARSICNVIEDQPSQPKPSDTLSNGEISKLDVSLSNSGMHEKIKYVASDFSSEISAVSLAPSISSAGLQQVEKASQNLPDESAEPGLEPSSSSKVQDVDEIPPLPPLPPMEWRLGKLSLGSLTSSGDPIRHPLVTNPFMELRTGDEMHSPGPVTTGVEMVQQAIYFSCSSVTESERCDHVSLISEEETAQPSRLSELSPAADEVREDSSQIVEGGTKILSNPFSVVSQTEDGKSSSDNKASVPEFEDETAQHSQLSEEGGQSGQHRGLQLSDLLRSLELERSQLEACNVARNPVPPLNPFLVVSSPEEWNNQYGYGVYGHESGQHLNLSAPFAAIGPNVPPYGFLYPIGENPSTIYDFMIPATEGEKKYRTIRDRPRDPLIEAVAAHDKSKLRKVSDLDRPPVQPTADERNSLLEQIKNKSFNLKPANSTKPNIKGVPGVPPTNLKIAAILEKANAIRQACVGSDEDEDDGDSWNDT